MDGCRPYGAVRRTHGDSRLSLAVWTDRSVKLRGKGILPPRLHLERDFKRDVGVARDSGIACSLAMFMIRNVLSANKTGAPINAKLLKLNQIARLRAVEIQKRGGKK